MQYSLVLTQISDKEKLWSTLWFYFIDLTPICNSSFLFSVLEWNVKLNEDQEKSHNESKFSTPNFKEFSSHKMQKLGLDTRSVFQTTCIKSSSVYAPREFQELLLGKANRGLEIFMCCSLLCKKLDFMTTTEVSYLE